MLGEHHQYWYSKHVKWTSLKYLSLGYKPREFQVWYSWQSTYLYHQNVQYVKPKKTYIIQ